MMTATRLLMTTSLSLTLVCAHASELVYRPISPAFGGKALNSQFLLGTAQAQNDFKDPDRRNNDDPAQQFTNALQNRLLNALANQVTEALFGENPQDSGEIVFGGQTIRFDRGLDAITIEISDADTGSNTVIEVPTLQLN